MLKRSLVLLILLALGACAAYAQSAKATFAYNELLALNGNSGWTPILTQQVKVSQAKDLFIDASLQCGIVTDTTVKSIGGSLDTDEARGTIRVRVAIYRDGSLIGFAQPDAGRDATGALDPANALDPPGVVFADRIQTLLARFAGLNCTAGDGGVVTCTDPEELQLILKTLNANSFNFVAPDLAQGVYTIEVQAKTTVQTGSLGIGDALNKTNAFIGAGSVSIESVRMIKGEQVEF